MLSCIKINSASNILDSDCSLVLEKVDIVSNLRESGTLPFLYSVFDLFSWAIKTWGKK